MSAHAKALIAGVIVMGFAALALAAGQWRSTSNTRFFTYLLLALAASTLKLRLRGLDATISVGFVFVLIGVADFSFSETVAMAAASALVQCMWRVVRRPSLVQVLFSVASLAISGGLAYASNTALIAAQVRYLPITITLAAGVLYGTNSLLVTSVVSLVQRQPFQQVFDLTHLYSVPLYLAGGLVAALNSASARVVGWGPSLLVLPAMYLVFVYYRLLLRQLTARSQ